MMTVLTAMAAMVGACLAVHLGLTGAIARTVLKAAQCHRCATFWLTLSVLVSIKTALPLAALLAIIMSYLSNYVILLFLVLQKFHDSLWQRIQNPQSRQQKKKQQPSAIEKF